MTAVLLELCDDKVCDRLVGRFYLEGHGMAKGYDHIGRAHQDSHNQTSLLIREEMEPAMI